MNDNNQSAGNKFIFNDNFYSDLENVNSELPPQRDLLAPLNEQPKVEKKEEKVEVNEEPLKEVKIDIPDVITTPSEEKNEIVDDISDTVPIPVVPEIKAKEEEKEIKIEEPEPTIPEVQILEPIVEEKKEEPTEEVKVVEPEKKEINLEVNTGIDTKLESEILKFKEEPTENIYVAPAIEKKPEEKQVYRAVRRQVINNIPQDREEVLPVKDIETPKEVIPQKIDKNWVPPYQPSPIVITETVSYYEEDTTEAVKSTIIEDLKKKEQETGKFSILARYGDDFCAHDYITNPAIGREKEIKALDLILLTPEKSAILIGKPGIGKTSIVEGLAYKLQRGQVPDALKGYTIISVKTASLLGKLPNGETRLQTLVDELKELDKIILFIDEVHMLIEASDESNLDFANLFKESLGRGSIKMIGATTTEEYERYVLRDKAFVRRFQRIDVAEPTKEETVEIVMGTLPKIEANTGAKLMYTHFIQVEIVNFIVNITSEYKRVYSIGSRYPDVCLTLMTQAFSEARFDNRTEVNIKDIRNAILKSKNIYPDVIKKELVNFDKQFKQLLEEAE